MKDITRRPAGSGIRPAYATGYGKARFVRNRALPADSCSGFRDRLFSTLSLR